MEEKVIKKYVLDLRYLNFAKSAIIILWFYRNALTGPWGLPSYGEVIKDSDGCVQKNVTRNLIPRDLFSDTVVDDDDDYWDFARLSMFPVPLEIVSPRPFWVQQCGQYTRA